MSEIIIKFVKFLYRGVNCKQTSQTAVAHLSYINPLTCMSHYSGFCIITCKHLRVRFFNLIFFVFGIHTLCISVKSFLQLQWLSFNTKGVTGTRMFSYTELYKANTDKQRKMLPVY